MIVHVVSGRTMVVGLVGSAGVVAWDWSALEKVGNIGRGSFLSPVCLTVCPD